MTSREKKASDHATWYVKRIRNALGNAKVQSVDLDALEGILWDGYNNAYLHGAKHEREDPPEG